MEIVGLPVSLADRNDHSWQKLCDKNHALFPVINIIWQSSCTFVPRMFPVCLMCVPGGFQKGSRMFEPDFLIKSLYTSLSMWSIML